MSAAVAPGSPKAAKPKKATKAKAAAAPRSHPVYADMVKRAITELKEKKGSSRAAILKYIVTHYKVGENLIQVSIYIFEFLYFICCLG